MTVLVASLFLQTGCGVKISQLPQINYPYVAEIEFLKKVENSDGEAKKTRFLDNQVHSPFDFFIKIKEIEDEGTVRVVFYSDATPPSQEPSASIPTKEPKMDKATEFFFDFGEVGKYYEYILFFDSVTELTPGKHRYAIFLRERLLYEGCLQVY